LLGGGVALAVVGGIIGAAPSEAAPSIVVALAPGAPTGVHAEVTSNGVYVTWAAPADTGGGTITKYQVSAQPSDVRATTNSNETSLYISELANGVDYRFTVRARNSTDPTTWGPASAPSNSVRLGDGSLSTVPGAPTGVTASIDPAVPGVAVVSWTHPANNGGAFVRSWRIEATPGTSSTPLEVNDRLATSAEVTGMVPNVSYTFQVKAVNDVGPSVASAPSNAVMHTDGGSAATLPDAPTGVTATAGDGEAVVSWTPPANTGGLPLTGYRISIRGEQFDATIDDGNATSGVVTGLTNGQSYKFKVSAKNALGEGAPSELSNAVVPGTSGNATVPGAPTGVVATVTGTRITVSWTPPANNGGSSILKYWVSVQPGTATSVVDAPATTTTFSALNPNTPYVFKVAAVNAVGRGLDSTGSAPVSFTPTAPGDWGGDGNADLLARKPNGELWLYSGDGVRSFLPDYRKIGSGWHVFTAVLAAGDWNGDGYKDVIARNSAGELILYRGDGTGGFIKGYPKIGSGWGSFTAIFTPGDWDGDGNADLIGRTSTGDLRLYRGAGTASGAFFSGYTKIGSGWNMFNAVLSAGDWNGDGKADVIARTPGGELRLYRGNGTGFTSGYQRIGSGWQIFDRILSTGDFNGDRRPDLVARRSSGEIYLYRGTGSPSGAFISPYLRIGTGWQVFNSVLGGGV
jgi:hypothetical protein